MEIEHEYLFVYVALNARLLDYIHSKHRYLPNIIIIFMLFFTATYKYVLSCLCVLRRSVRHYTRHEKAGII